MKVVILGVGRSGTTALYRLLQDILKEKYDDVDFVYEPFLWDYKKLNDMYENIVEKFNYTDSISIEGSYENKKLPLFIEKNELNNYTNNDYLNCMFKSENILAKFIRANGRINLIKEMFPDAKIILITRNPIDTINSSSELFSYYGSEFFESDYERFKNEVLDIYGDSISTVSPIEKEVYYWYYMNKFALESFDEKSMLKLTHESFIFDKEKTITSILDYLEIKDINIAKYIDNSKKIVGPKTKNINITENEFHILKKFNTRYFNEFKTTFNLDTFISEEEHLSKYSNATFRKKRENDFLSGKTTLFIRNYCNSQLSKKSSIINAIKNMLKDN